MADQNSEKQPLSAAEIDFVKSFMVSVDCGVADADNDEEEFDRLTIGQARKIADVFGHLLSMLQPPTTKCECDMRTKLIGDGCAVCNPELAREMGCTSSDAAVREAVEETQHGMRRVLFVRGRNVCIVGHRHLRTLLSFIRAAQAQRLTGDRLEAVKWAKGFIMKHGGHASAWVDERHIQGESEAMDSEMEKGLAYIDAAFPELGEG